MGTRLLSPGRVLYSTPLLNIRIAPPTTPPDKGQQKQHNKDKEQDFSNRSRARRDAEKSEGTGNHRYNEEDDCPT